MLLLLIFEGFKFLNRIIECLVPSLLQKVKSFAMELFCLEMGQLIQPFPTVLSSIQFVIVKLTLISILTTESDLSFRIKFKLFENQIRCRDVPGHSRVLFCYENS